MFIYPHGYILQSKTIQMKQTKTKILSRNYLQRTAKNVFTFGYGMPKDALDCFGTLGGTEYFITNMGDVYKMNRDNKNSFTRILSQIKF